MYLDSIGFLPEHPLTKVDRSTMSVSLEARVPLLDRNVVEFAWRLPLHQRIRGGSTKFLLRQVLYRYVPRELIERPKVGFRVPMGDWLRGPLRAWAQKELDPVAIEAQGFLDASLVTSAWQRHLAGTPKLTEMLWCVLVFQTWLNSNRHARATPS
jgi:asparagine synthase (glutamine-hydrolysing)